MNTATKQRTFKMKTYSTKKRTSQGKLETLRRKQVRKFKTSAA